LDLGCGCGSPIQHCSVSHSVGVEAFEPYLDESRKRGIHKEYILEDISRLDFEPKSFDAVIMIDVLEHLEKDSGRVVLEKAEKWARKKVIVSTPNGFLPAESVEGNPFQAHRSGWTIGEMRELGYKVYGTAGWRFLRRKELKDVGGGRFVTVRFRPKTFWWFVSGLTQTITYYFPRLAYELFCVKKVGGGR